jgi:hypothetical protein
VDEFASCVASFQSKALTALNAVGANWGVVFDAIAQKVQETGKLITDNFTLIFDTVITSVRVFALLLIDIFAVTFVMFQENVVMFLEEQN